MKLRVVEQLVPRDNGRPAADITPASLRRKFAVVHCRYFAGTSTAEISSRKRALNGDTNACRVRVLFQDRSRRGSSINFSLFQFSSHFVSIFSIRAKFTISRRSWNYLHELLITIIVKPNCRINIEYLKTTLFEIFIDKLTFSTLVERYRFIYEKLVYVSSFLSLFKLSLIYFR